MPTQSKLPGGEKNSKSCHTMAIHTQIPKYTRAQACGDGSSCPRYTMLAPENKDPELEHATPQALDVA